MITEKFMRMIWRNQLKSELSIPKITMVWKLAKKIESKNNFMLYVVERKDKEFTVLISNFVNFK